MKTNVSVRIMDTDYQLLCETEEKDILVKGAGILNQHLKDFRRNNPSVDIEKVLIMGALRATCELVGELDTLSDQAKITNGEIKKTLEQLS